MQLVRAVVREALEAIAGGMGVVVPLQVKALEVDREMQAVVGEVMRRLAVLDKGMVGMKANASQGQFMETFFYYPCWEVRVVVVDGVLAALVVAARF
jgi:hypothetical protein